MEIEVGDWVWSRDEVTGEEGFKPVVEVFGNTSDRLVHLTYTTSAGEGTLTGTAEHPFWSVSQGSWVAMGGLHAGEQLLLAGGATATVASVRTELLAQPVTVYNFEVADWHTYHVGNEHGWVFVHNRCNGNRLRSGRAQHGYEIVDTATGDVVKTGVSGGKRTLSGGSYRGNAQAAEWSREAGQPGKYLSRVVHQVPKGPWARMKILDWEKLNAQRLQAEGHLSDPTRHRRPR